jgi:hydroxylaminobenzene mutase
MQEVVLVAGVLLALLGMLTGLLAPVAKNRRALLTSHLEGTANGTLLIAFGLMWSFLELSRAAELATVVLAIYGTYANWFATGLAALWGAGRKAMPLASGEFEGTKTQENVIAVLLLTVAVTIIAATVLILVGLLR